MMKAILTSALLVALATPAFAQVQVSAAWVRATVPQQKATGAFMSLTASKSLRLVEAKSPIADIVEIHQMTIENNVMKMRAVSRIDLPAGKTVELKPGGYHVMLMALKQQVREGESVPITLVVEDQDNKRTTIEVKALVRSLTARGAGKEHGH